MNTKILLSICLLLTGSFARADLTPIFAGSGAVDSVNGQTGVVVVGTDDIAEGVTNLYFTDARAKNSCVADAINDGTTNKAPSQNAVFDALALKEVLSNKDTDGTLAANSDTKYASQKATKTYADTKAAGTASSIDSEIALFSGTGGKTLKRATGTGFVKVSSGVMQSSSATVSLSSEVSGVLPFANQASIPKGHELWINGSRADSYTEDGTFSRPYKTIMGAIGAGVTGAVTYHIVGPYTYAENVTFDATTGQSQVAFLCHDNADIAPASGKSWQWDVGNDNLDVLTVKGCKFSSDVELIGAVDASAIGGTNIAFDESVFIGNVVVKNVEGIGFAGDHFFGNVTIENIGGGGFIMNGGQGMAGGLLSIVSNNANPKPADFSGTVAIVEKTLIPGPVSVDAGSIFQIREGSRIGAPGQDVNVAGAFTAYNSTIRGNLLLASGSSFTLNSTQFDPSLTTDSGTTFTNNSKIAAKSLMVNASSPATIPSFALDVNDAAIRVRSSTTPASASASCAQGTIAWDTDYVYVCVATDTWKRTAIATW